MTSRIVLFCLLSLLVYPYIKAEVSVPALFSSHMVLQRDTSVLVWGWADENENIQISFRGNVYRTRTDREGNWQVYLNASEAGGPFQLVIKGKNCIILEDVYVGDVWLCAGQSNMLYRLSLEDEAASELPNAGRHNLKLFKISPDTAHTPESDFPQVSWKACASETAKDFSAVAYYLGVELEKNLDHVPIGLIQSACGSSTAEAWMSREAMESSDNLRKHLLNYSSSVAYKNPTKVYNAMLHPLHKFTIKGVVWYQGESNVLRASEYNRTLPTMIADWRKTFRNEQLSFYIVEIPPYNYSKAQQEPGKSNSAEVLRIAQKNTALEDTYCELVPTSDLGNPNKLHPTNKKVLGQRIAHAILTRERSSMPDISSIPADLFLPELSGDTGPGKRVKMQLMAYKGTQVYHIMCLPENWKPGRKYPVIVEYPGNGPYVNRFGDQCSGQPEDCSLGYGISGGKDYIVLSLPFISENHKDIKRYWWGDLEAGKRYCLEALQEAFKYYGGDSRAVILTGFSRGAIACNYLGLHDDEIASTWLAFIAYDHYDGAREWPYNWSDVVSAKERLRRLNGRHQLIVSSAGSNAVRTYIESTGISGQFTYLPLPFRNHNDQWILRNTAERAFLRKWLAEIIKNRSLDNKDSARIKVGEF